MTGFLASVQSLREAQIALDRAVDIIDLKAPDDGVLGAVPPPVQRQVVDYVQGRCLISATVGDLPAVPDLLQAATTATAANGVNLVKIGFFEPGARSTLIAALSDTIARGVRVVAVLFADRETDLLGVLESLAETGFVGVMLDTADKAGGRLRSHLEDAAIGRFIEHTKRLGLTSGLAGSLAVSDIAPLLRLKPDYLGFRGALCHDGRGSDLDPERVNSIRARIPLGAATIVMEGETARRQIRFK